MAGTHVGFNQVELWSSKHYRIAANVPILLNVMHIFRMVLTNTGKNPILVNWILHPKKTNSLYEFFTITSGLFKKNTSATLFIHRK
jgi:hypothetical protein